MLDNKDINKLKSVLLTKEDAKNFATKKDLDEMSANSLKVFATKKDVEEIKSDISDLRKLVQGILVASDSLLKSMSDLKMKYAAISTQLTRHERWIKQIAEKVGLNLAME